MTDKELRKLSRKDLLQILIAQSKELQDVKKKLEKTEEALKDKRLRIDQAGSIAAAALQLNDVFQSAENACRQYIDNIQELQDRQDRICEEREQESQKKAQEMIEAAQKKCRELEAETKARCEEMLAEAKWNSSVYWDEVLKHLDKFGTEHIEETLLLKKISEANKDRMV